MSNSMYLKTVAVVVMLCAISFAASTVTPQQGTQNNASTEKKRQILITGSIFSAEPNGPSVTTFLKDKLKASPIAPGIDPNKEEMQFYEMADSQAIALINWLSSTAKAQILASPKMLALEGEQTSIRTTKDKKYLKEYKEPNGPTAAPEPAYDNVVVGTIFDVKAEFRPILESMLLKIKLQTIELLRMEKKVYKPGYEIEIPMLKKAEMETRISMPDGQTIFMPVGGQDNRKVYLLVKASVVPEKSDLILQPETGTKQPVSAPNSLPAEQKPQGVSAKFQDKWLLDAKQVMDEHTGKTGIYFGISYIGMKNMPDPNIVISHYIKSLKIGGISVAMTDLAGKVSICNKIGSGGRFFLPEEIEGLENLKPGKYPVVLVLEGDIYKSNTPKQPLEHWQITIEKEIELNALLLGPFVEANSVGAGKPETTAGQRSTQPPVSAPNSFPARQRKKCL